MSRVSKVDWGILATVLILVSAAWVWSGPVEDAHRKWERAQPTVTTGTLRLCYSSALVPGADKLKGHEKWHVRKSGLKAEDYEGEMPVVWLDPPIKID